MKKVLIVSVAAALALATGGAVTGTKPVAVAETSLPSAQSFMDIRSPGDRIGYGELSPTKQRKLSEAIVAKTKLVYRETPSGTHTTVYVPASVTLGSDIVLSDSFEIADLPAIDSVSRGSNANFIAGPTNTRGFIRGGDGTTPVSPSVPEPTTWLSLTLGFIIMGCTMRYGSQKRVSLV